MAGKTEGGRVVLGKSFKKSFRMGTKKGDGCRGSCCLGKATEEAAGVLFPGEGEPCGRVSQTWYRSLSGRYQR